jgi:hypothetical protein
MSDGVLQQIEADIAEAERLMTELRLKIAVGQSAGEDTTESERRVQEMLKGWMLLQDQRAKASGEPITIKGTTSQQDRDLKPARSPETPGRAASTGGLADRADRH